MAITKRILALVLAGGEGTRLRPLTDEHAKPALPFAGGTRIVDFVLSNLFNSRISCVYVLAQYKPRSLIEHLGATWGLSSPSEDRLLEVLLPRKRGEGRGYRGTADAVYQNLHLIERHEPDMVAVFAADHVYRMDVRQMLDFHESRRAEVSVAALPVPLDKASSFGIIAAEAGGRIREFQEKPDRPAAMADRPDRAYASMGNYLFEPEALIAALRQANANGEYDFGRHLLPRLAHNGRTFAYDFSTNKVPGVQPYEEPAYWRDVGTVEAYRAALRDVLGSRPRFQLWNSEWPIRGGAADRAAARPSERAKAFTLQLPGQAALRARVPEREEARRERREVM